MYHLITPGTLRQFRRARRNTRNDISIIGWARPYSKNSVLPVDLPSHEATRRPSTPTPTPSPRVHSVLMPLMLKG